MTCLPTVTTISSYLPQYPFIPFIISSQLSFSPLWTRKATAFPFFQWVFISHLFHSECLLGRAPSINFPLSLFYFHLPFLVNLPLSRSSISFASFFLFFFLPLFRNYYGFPDWQTNCLPGRIYPSLITYFDVCGMTDFTMNILRITS